MNESFFEYLKNENIRLVFNPYIMEYSNSEESEYSKDLNYFADLSKKYSMEIVRVSGIGNTLGFQASGRSYYASPTGIKWKVANSENNMEIIKTVNINV